MVRKINEDNFDLEIKDGVVVVDFFAIWCGPCKMLSPIFENLSREMNEKVKFVKLDVDENIQVARRYNINSIPTMMIFKNGKAVDKIVGFSPKDKIVAKIQKYI